MASSIYYLVNRMNGTCGCSALCNDSRFLIFIVLFGKNKILSRKLLNFQNGHHILPNLKCAGVIHCWLFIKNKKKQENNYQASDVRFCLPSGGQSAFIRLVRHILENSWVLITFQHYSKQLNGNVCQLRVVFLYQI